MKLNIYPDNQTLSARVADEVIALIKRIPDAVFCLASGDTPRLACQLIAQRVINEGIDFGRCTFVGLDEWLGVPPDNEGSCNNFFKTLLIDPLGLSPNQTFLFDALAKNPQEECKKMDERIFNKGGIDLMVVGIGMNGHIGFNEPGISVELYSHVADLADSTITVGQKYFSSPTDLKLGITLGLKHLMESKRVILMANGMKKARVIADAVGGQVSNEFPATIIQRHQNAEVAIDVEASSELNLKLAQSQNQ